MTYTDLATDYIYGKVLEYAKACSSPSPEDTAQDFFLKAGIHHNRYGNVDKYFYDSGGFNARLAFVSVQNILRSERVKRKKRYGKLIPDDNFDSVFVNHLIVDQEINYINLHSINLFTDTEKSFIGIRLNETPYRKGLAILGISSLTFAKIRSSVQKKLLMFYYV